MAAVQLFCLLSEHLLRIRRRLPSLPVWGKAGKCFVVKESSFTTSMLGCLSLSVWKLVVLESLLGLWWRATHQTDLPLALGCASYTVLGLDVILGICFFIVRWGNPRTQCSRLPVKITWSVTCLLHTIFSSITAMSASCFWEGLILVTLSFLLEVSSDASRNCGSHMACILQQYAIMDSYSWEYYWLTCGSDIDICSSD